VSGEKTEKPTEQRKKEARKEGRATARTPDLGAWAGIFAASIVVPTALNSALQHARALLEELPGVIAKPDPGNALHLLREGAMAAAMSALPVCGTLLAVGLAAAAAQGGVRPAMKLLMPKFSRLNPMSGIKKNFGPQGAWEAAKALLKTVVLGAVLYSVVRGVVQSLMLSGSLSLSATVGTVVNGVVGLIRTAAGAGLALAAADYVMVKRRVGKGLKMSKQDIKDEYKKTEGDPHVKGQIRQRQRAMARNRMMADVPKADVVVVNPTHVAVALRYDPSKGAPRVLAKGSGTIAAKIRERAGEHRIPMVQDVPLARALYAGCDIGAEIPPEFYGAVARVLAFVMGLKAKGSAAGLHRPFGSPAA
jgi:flagellar biosynthetic protein FlhB